MDEFYSSLIAALESIGNAIAENPDTRNNQNLERAFDIVEGVVIDTYGSSPFED